MINFDFVSPTKIYFGKGRENELAKELNEFGYKRILIVYGEGSIKRIGLYDNIVKQLTSASVFFAELSGIRPNPSSIKVDEGIKICREKNIDLLLAIGGGSVIDTAKAIACGYYYDGDAFDLNLGKAKPTKALPVGVILTISASGSELSDSCVVMNDKTLVKQGFNSDLVRPVFAIMNPELTYSVSKYQTGCGIVDIISHSLERYFSKSEHNDVADSFALSVIKETIRSGAIAIENPNDYDARADLMLLGSYSHNGLTSLGKAKVMPIHKMEHALSAYDIRIAHGAGLSVLIPAWMDECYKNDLDKFVRFSKEVFDIKCNNKEECAKLGIQSLRYYFKKIGMPVTLGELKLNKDDIPQLVDMMTNKGTLVIGQTSIKPLTKEEIIRMLNSIL